MFQFLFYLSLLIPVSDVSRQSVSFSKQPRYLAFAPSKFYNFDSNHEEVYREFKLDIVKHSTSILPKADFISHAVLKLNEDLVNFLIEHKEIPMELKKPLILNIISSAQLGDEMGGRILEFYHDLVNHLL